MKTVFLLVLFFLTHGVANAGGGGSGWTSCHLQATGFDYWFDGYIRSRQVGDTINVFEEQTKKFGKYQIDEIDLGGEVGVVSLHHVPLEGISWEDSDFGQMKIEYLSDSALKDILVTFTMDGKTTRDSAVCSTD